MKPISQHSVEDCSVLEVHPAAQRGTRHPECHCPCKIHHAVYDRILLGIRPNCQVEINAGLLLEIDGPMLKHGLQEMNGQKLLIPSFAQSRPDPERLQVRYEEFKNAS